MKRLALMLIATAGSMTAMASAAHAQAGGAPQPVPRTPPPAGGTGIYQNGQTETHTEFAREWSMREMMTSPESYSAAQALAATVTQCVVDKMGKDAGSLLGGPMTKDEKYEKLVKALSKDHRACLKPEAAGIPMVIVNSSLAERVVLGSGKDLEPRAMSLNQDEADAFTTMGPGVKLNFDIIGRCAAVYSPGLTYKVLETEPGSDSEKAALDALYKNTPECGLREAPDGAPTGYQRGVLASGLYHWLHRG